MQKPNLYDYLSATRFLQDIYFFRKNENPGFTYESWASELGFKSRSLLTMIINKERRISSLFIQSFCATAGFDSDSRSYFWLLTQLEQSPSEDEKRNFLNRLQELRGKQKDLIEIHDHHEFLSTDDLPLLLVLLSFVDVDRTASGLAVFLKKPVEQIQKYLESLRRMGLAVCQENVWIPTKKSFKVPAKAGSTALKQYHKRSLLQAIAAQEQPPQQRRFRSVLLPLSEKDYSELLNDIEALVQKAVAKYDAHHLHEKRIYKVNVNAFPMTENFPIASKIIEVHNPENETGLV